MAGEDRTSTHAVELAERLRRAPHGFGFFQALRRLECVHRDKMRLGEAVRAADEPVRLGQEPSLAFAPSTLASFGPGRNGGRPRLATYFFGLFGPNGPLPLHLTEYARERSRNAGDDTFVRFADIFHHRMLSLFYRAWANAQPTVNFDRPGDDRFAAYVGALCGLGMSALRDRDAMPDLAKLHFAGLLAVQTRSAEGLQAMLGALFSVPVRIEEFVGDWLDLPESCWWRLGESPESGSLGETTTVGERVWSRHHKFRIVFGAMGMAEYRTLLPDNGHLAFLVALVRNYSGDELSWDVNLVLKKEEVPRLQLGGWARLGWTTWLASGPARADADDLTFDPLAYAARSAAHGADSGSVGRGRHELMAS